MAQLPENDSLDRLDRKLYSPAGVKAFERSRLRPGEEVIAEGWAQKEESPMSRKKKTTPIFKVLIASVIFFIVAVLAAFFVLFRESNLVSPQNVSIEAESQTTLKAGEIINLQVVVANHNSASLKSTYLSASFPPGSRSATNLSQELTVVRVPLGDIKPGESIKHSFKAVLFGEQNQEQKIILTAEYRLAESNAIFDKSIDHSVLISSAPILINLDVPPEVGDREEFKLILEIVSEAEAPIADVLIVGQYPPGFSFTRAEPAASSGNNVWRLGDLPPGAEKTIAITGLVAGEHEEDRIFRFTVGQPEAAGGDSLGISYHSVEAGVKVERPGVGLHLTVNGQSAPAFVASSGEMLRVDAGWVNNLPVELHNAEVELYINGAVVNESSVSVPRGVYRSGDDRALWTQGSFAPLRRIAAGEIGQVSLNFSVLPLVSPSSSVAREPKIDLRLVFTSERTTPTGAGQTVRNEIKKEIKINSVFQLTAKALHTIGPLETFGPLPPEVEERTAYTIVWSVINSSNLVRNAEVRATLPAYVEWAGVTAPAQEQISFDETTGEVIWRLDSVEAGRGLSSAAREVAFQIVLVPSANQIGEEVDLISAATLTGLDSFTGAELRHRRSELDTILDQDPGFRSGDGEVAR